MTVTNPTLEGGSGKTFASSGTSTLTLYGVRSETVSKASNLIEFPIPTQDSDQRIIMDLMGASRNITIEGVVTASDVSDLYKYADDLVGLGTDTLINGAQGTNGYNSGGGYNYLSELYNRNRGVNSGIVVYILDVSVDGEAGNTQGLRYSISMIECNGSTSV